MFVVYDYCCEIEYIEIIIFILKLKFVIVEDHTFTHPF